MSQPAEADIPVHLLLGEVRLLVEQAEARLVAAGLEGDASGFNFASFHAEEGAMGAIPLAQTAPMMARRRVVVIRGLEKADNALLEGLLAYADAPNPSTLLVLSGEKLPPASGGKNLGLQLSNRVKKVGSVQRFQADAVQPAAFAVEQARRGGCRLDGGAARLLVEMVGSDLGRLQGEVEKLVCFAGGEGTIDSRMVEAVCSLVAEAKIWDLTDGLVRRDPDVALAAAHRLLEEGYPSHQLLATVTWQFRQLLELQEAMQRGAPPPGSWGRVPRQKLADAQRLLSRRPLSPARVLGALTETNRAFNRSRAGDRRVFEGLVLRLAAM